MNGRPPVIAFPDEPESWFQTFTFPIAMKEVALVRLMRLPPPGRPLAIKPRSWLVRLFSWPWRPHHNMKVWTATGEVTGFEIETDDERVRFKVHGEGCLTTYTTKSRRSVLRHE